MRKFLSEKFWSHGTSPGSLGPLSQGDVHAIWRLRNAELWGADFFLIFSWILSSLVSNLFLIFLEIPTSLVSYVS